uniref:Uncharacterized protein n=1 Tax=Timspurckia oligopyrenoides TaxID=708627 RepID=A0A7S1EPB4_9RHOD|mmetsp:Transcript_10338/g.18633  ORF Transcript_10338/g.18633 Transcript_10338/m.18633 type:complete len:287 (+) Transcript_10338:63-923(+)
MVGIVREVIDAMSPTTVMSSSTGTSTGPIDLGLDATRAFHVCLYVLVLEGFLFFAVVTQTKSQEPGAHGGVARAAGLLFLFQSLSAFTLVLSNQLFPSRISMYSSIASVVFIILSSLAAIPASASIAVPEARRRSWKTVAVIAWLAIVLSSAFFLGPMMRASPSLPFISGTFRRQLLGAMIGAMACILLSCIVRMLRPLKGRNGAFVLLLGTGLILIGGILWSQMDPKCDTSSVKDWPSSCPMPRAFDHNVLFVVLLLFGNIFAAEGVLRLMAAGNGSEGYVEIMP